jgi:NAD(P)H-quinone oxidoreductase subunit 5
MEILVKINAFPLLILALLVLSGRLAQGLAMTKIWEKSCAYALALQVLVALVGLVLVSQPQDLSLASLPGAGGLSFESFALLFDRLSLLMLAFISFVGLAVFGDSMRYMEGEPRKRYFMTAMLFTILSAELLVLSGSLILFAVAWILMSIGLHALLTFYEQRPRALLAARKKFLISRIADIFLLVAVVLLVTEFNSVLFSDVLAALQKSKEFNWNVGLAAVCLTIAALIKSAQVPFHSWLPDTLESPTPVSALMHAGIINGGGYALIRFAPLLEASGLAQSIAIFFGLLSLAYSLAVVHILGHGFYKAQSFLRSGTIEDAIDSRLVPQSKSQLAYRLSFGFVLGFVALLLCSTVFSLPLSNWPGGIVSLAILLFGVTQIFAPKLKWLSLETVARGIIVFGITAWAFAVEAFLHSNFSALNAAQQGAGSANFLLQALALLVIGVLAAASFVMPWLTQSRIGAKFYCHAANGFYLGIYADRLVDSFFNNRLVDYYNRNLTSKGEV